MNMNSFANLPSRSCRFLYKVFIRSGHYTVQIMVSLGMLLNSSVALAGTSNQLSKSNQMPDSVLQKGDSLHGADLEKKGIFWLNELSLFSAERFVNGRNLTSDQKRTIAFRLQNGTSEMQGFQYRKKNYSPLAIAVLLKAKECVSLRNRNKEFAEADCFDELESKMRAYGAQVVKAKYFLGYMQNIRHTYDQSSQNYRFISNGFRASSICQAKHIICYVENEGSAVAKNFDKVCMQSKAQAYDIGLNFPEAQIRVIGKGALVVGAYSLFKVTEPFRKVQPGSLCGDTSVSAVIFEGTIEYNTVVFVEPDNEAVVSFVPISPSIKISN